MPLLAATSPSGKSWNLKQMKRLTKHSKLKTATNGLGQQTIRSSRQSVPLESMYFALGHILLMRPMYLYLFQLLPPQPQLRLRRPAAPSHPRRELLYFTLLQFVLLQPMRLYVYDVLTILFHALSISNSLSTSTPGLMQRLRKPRLLKPPSLLNQSRRQKNPRPRENFSS